MKLDYTVEGWKSVVEYYTLTDVSRQESKKNQFFNLARPNGKKVA